MRLKGLLNNSTAKRFVANTGWLVFDKIFHMVLSLVVTSMTARYLGTEGYGIINYGLSFINIFTIVCKLGIDSIIVNELVKNKNKTGEIVGTTLVLRLLSSLCSLVLTFIFVSILKPGQIIVMIITMIQSISLLFVALDTVDFYFQSILKSKYTAIARSISYPLVCLLRIVFILIKADVTWFAWATVLDSLTIGIILIYFYVKKEKVWFSFSMSRAKYLLKNSHPFIWANLLVTIYTQMDRIMVGSLVGDAETGIYSAAMTIANLWIFVPNALIDSARPIIMELKAKARESEYRLRYAQLYAGVMWISVAAGIFFTIFSKLVIVIIYGQDYMEAVPVLMILIWSRLFSLIGTARNIWMICEDSAEYVKWFVGFGAALNVGLNFVLIPVIGAEGAAIATLITEIASSFLIVGAFKKTRPLFKFIIEAFLLKNIKSNKKGE